MALANSITSSNTAGSVPGCFITSAVLFFQILGLADAFNNESVIDRPAFAVHGDALVGLAVIPVLCGFHVREFRNDDSLNRITFKNFVLSIGYEHFDGMAFHCCFDSSPVFFELFLIHGFSSREYNVCRHNRYPSLFLRPSVRTFFEEAEAPCESPLKPLGSSL